MNFSKFGKHALRMAKYAGVGVLAGAASGASTAASGNKRYAAKEGAITGAIVGVAIASPGAASLALAIPRKAIVAFRRIRGRIVPIRVKA